MTLTQLLFSFKGRINRKPWWVASLGAGFAASLLTAILEAVARSAGETIVNPVTHQFEPTGIFGLAISLIGLVNAWIAFALSVKRLHDRDRTGWWLLWQILVIIVAVILIVVAIRCRRNKGRCGMRWRPPPGSRPSPSRFGCSSQIGFLGGRKARTASAPTRSAPLGTTRSSRANPIDPRCRRAKRLYRSARSRVPRHDRAERKSG